MPPKSKAVKQEVTNTSAPVKTEVTTNNNKNKNQKAEKFSTTGSGLIVYNFDSDSDDDAPAPVTGEDMVEEIKVTAPAAVGGGQFFTDLSRNPAQSDHFDVQYDQFDKLKAANHDAYLSQKVNTHAELIRKRALSSKNQLKVVNNKDVQQQQSNARLEALIRAEKKKFWKKQYDVADSDMDSEASDYDEHCLPYLEEAELKAITTRANKALQHELQKEKVVKMEMGMVDKEDDAQQQEEQLTEADVKKYELAARALESDSEDDMPYGDIRFGESDIDEDDEDEEEEEEEEDGQIDLVKREDGVVAPKKVSKKKLDKSLSQDVFETQTQAYTTDEHGDVVKVNHNISFNEMFLSKPTILNLQQNNFIKPTPIQAAAVPMALKGFDIMANAVTGSGKTIAFLLPIIERLTRMPSRTRAIRAVIITPTRELAEQIFKVAVNITRHNTASQDISISCIYGGVNSLPQEHELRQHPDIVVCTPGRMIDHLTNTMGVSIDRCEVLVLDEADRLLDMGFRDEVGHIIDLTPSYRQTLLFSATINSDVEDLIKKSLKGYRRVFVDKASSIVKTLTQQFIRIRHDNDVLRQALVLSLCKREFKSKCIIFTKTKQHAQALNVLFKLTGLRSGELHGNLSQVQRSEVLEEFRKGELDFLIATDVASRGLDIKGVLTVINMHLPINYNSYVHRVGRTARAGEKGTAISLVADLDRKLLKDMMKVHDMDQDDNIFNNAKKDPNATAEAEKKKKKDNSSNLLLNLKKREIAPAVIDKYSAKIQALQPHVEEILEDLRSSKELDEAEKQLSRAERLAAYTVKDAKAEATKTKREWFQSTSDRKALQDKLKSDFKAAAGVVATATDLLQLADEAKADGKDEKKKKSLQEQLRGLSRDEKRRKMYKMEQEKIANDIRRELKTNTEMSEKERKNKEHELVSLIHPEITAGFVKRNLKRAKLAESVDKRDYEDDGAGPQAFEQYAKQYDGLKFQSNARKRKLVEDELSAKSSQVKYRRFLDQDSVKDPSKLKRFREATQGYDKKQKGMEKEQREGRKKTQSHNKFKSGTRYKRR